MQKEPGTHSQNETEESSAEGWGLDSTVPGGQGQCRHRDKGARQWVGIHHAESSGPGTGSALAIVAAAVSFIMCTSLWCILHRPWSLH